MDFGNERTTEPEPRPRIQRAATMECLICSERFNERSHIPRMLPCAHTFCSTCLAQCIAISGRDVVCCLCKRVTRVSHGVEDFPRNFALLEILENPFRGQDASMGFATAAETISRTLRAGLEDGDSDSDNPLCSACAAESDAADAASEKPRATHACADCRKTLCVLHSMLHTSKKVSSAHRMQAIGGAMCDQHFGAALDVFCGTHARMVCRACCGDTHRTCVTDSAKVLLAAVCIPSAVSNLLDRGRFRQLSMQAVFDVRAEELHTLHTLGQEWVGALAGAGHRARAHAAAVAVDGRQAKEAVAEHFAALRTALQNREEVLHASIAAAVLSKTSALQAQEARLRRAEEVVSATARRLHAHTTRSQAAAALRQALELVATMRDLEGQLDLLDWPSEPLAVAWYVSPTLFETMAHLGVIVGSAISPEGPLSAAVATPEDKGDSGTIGASLSMHSTAASELCALVPEVAASVLAIPPDPAQQPAQGQTSPSSGPIGIEHSGPSAAQDSAPMPSATPSTLDDTGKAPTHTAPRLARMGTMATLVSQRSFILGAAAAADLLGLNTAPADNRTDAPVCASGTALPDTQHSRASAALSLICDAVMTCSTPSVAVPSTSVSASAPALAAADVLSHSSASLDPASPPSVAASLQSSEASSQESQIALQTLPTTAVSVPLRRKEISSSSTSEMGNPCLQPPLGPSGVSVLVSQRVLTSSRPVSMPVALSSSNLPVSTVAHTAVSAGYTNMALAPEAMVALGQRASIALEMATPKKSYPRSPQKENVDASQRPQKRSGTPFASVKAQDGPEILSGTRTPLPSPLSGSLEVCNPAGLGGDVGQLNGPVAVALGIDGAIYVVDSNSNRVLVFHDCDQVPATPSSTLAMAKAASSPQTRTVMRLQRVLGCSGQGAGQLTGPDGVAVGPDGTVYVCDSENHRVQVFSCSGACVDSWGCYGRGPAQMRSPRGAAVGSGLLYVADHSNHRVLVFRCRDGKCLGVFGSKGAGPAQFQGPSGVAVSSAGLVAVADWGNDRIQLFQRRSKTVDHVYVASLGMSGRGQGQLQGPAGVAIGPDGLVYVADSGNDRVQVFRPGDGAVVASWGGPDGGSLLQNPTGVAVSCDGRTVFVADYGNNRIQAMTLVVT